MLLSNPHRALLLFLTAGVVQTKAAPADGAPNSLLPAFTLNGGNGGPETGRCIGHDLDVLKQSYEDMCLMARSASDEIDFLLSRAAETKGIGPPRPANAQAPEATVKDWKRWNRVRGTYISLFGSDPFVVPGGPGQPGQRTPGHPMVRRFYNLVVEEYCSGKIEKNSINPVVVCTDADYQFIKIGKPDPGDPQGRNIEDTNPQCTAIGGVWYSPNMRQGDQYINKPPPRSPGDKPFCTDPGFLASTEPEMATIFFCKAGLDTNVPKTVTLQDLRDTIKPTSTRYGKILRSREKVVTALEGGRITKLEDIKGDAGDIMPVTWLHEMHHLLTKSFDQPAFDKNGNRLKITKNVYNPNTNQYEDQEDDKLSYGYSLCSNLAKHSVLGITNPDNVAFFALAMFFGEQDWSRGFAMPIKEP